MNKMNKASIYGLTTGFLVGIPFSVLLYFVLTKNDDKIRTDADRISELETRVQALEAKSK